MMPVKKSKDQETLNHFILNLVLGMHNQLYQKQHQQITNSPSYQFKGVNQGRLLERIPEIDKELSLEPN